MSRIVRVFVMCALPGLPAALGAAEGPTPEAPASSPAPAATPPSAIQFSGMVQAWFASGNAGVRDTFRLRRIELKATGQAIPQMRWTVMLDPAKTLGISGTAAGGDLSVNQAGRLLQDALISVTPVKPLQIDVGQFKVPISYEGVQSSGTLDTVERILFASDRGRGGSFGDVRDIGLVLRWTASPQVALHAGLMNGSGESQNDVDRNDQKAAVGRLLVTPAALKGLHLGLAGVWAGTDLPDRPKRRRAGVELAYVGARLKLRGELIQGEDGALTRRGWYGFVGYRVRPKVEAVARVDAWDPDTDLETTAANAEERDYLAGVNWYLNGHKAKLMVDYVRKTFADERAPSRHLVLCNLQAAW